MKSRLLFFSFFILLFLAANSQFKDKRFREGYIIREGDTVKCKIHNGSLHESVTAKFRDSKFEDPTMYGPGGYVSGYGIKNEDSVYKHFYSFPLIMKNGLKKIKGNFFGLLHVTGYTKLLEVQITTYSGGYGSGSFNMGSIGGYYIYKTGADSSFLANKESILSSAVFEEEFTSKYFESHPDILAKLKKKLRLEDMVTLVKDYNSWYEEKEKTKKQ